MPKIKKNKILFTGGFSAGHVTPNLALIDQCRKRGWEVLYIGSKTGMERGLIEAEKIPYYAITTGKLRRYFSWQNFIDPFKVIVGIIQAYFLCRKHKPDLVFSKGGFVALGVVVGAWLNRIVVITHESDLTPGLANKLSAHFASKICVSFPETKKYIKAKNKVVVTGALIRRELFNADAERGRRTLKFNQEKPILLVMGGGQGALRINQALREILPQLLQTFQVVHLCGKGKMDPAFNHLTDYRQLEYLSAEFADVLACSDLVVSRAGANSVAEITAMKKPNILIPLAAAGRGDQVDNAQNAAKGGLSVVLDEAKLTSQRLLEMIMTTYQNQHVYLEKLKNFNQSDAVVDILDLFGQLVATQTN